MNLSLMLNENDKAIKEYEEYEDAYENSISLLLEDLFIRFGKYINDTQGFKEFTDYYLETRKYQRDLSFELHQYYDAVDEENIKEQMEILSKIVCITDIYRSIFINLTNDSFLNEFEEYFRNKKKNIDEINHYENNDLIISRLHSEWLLRSKQLEIYYEHLVEENTKSLQLNTKNNSLFNRFIEYVKPKEENIEIKSKSNDFIAINNIPYNSNIGLEISPLGNYEFSNHKPQCIPIPL